MRRFALAVLLASLVCRTAAANLIYDFDTPGTEASNGGHGDGQNADGWVNTLGASEASFTVFGGRTSVVPGSTQTGNQDTQNNNMVFTSPAFNLTGNTISVDLAGGQGNGATKATTGFPANISDISAGPADPNGILILGLRNVTTGNYVSFFQSPNNQDTWQTYSWDVSAVPHSGNYVIDQIDTRYGGWGHIELDNVNIQGTLTPEPSSFVLVGFGAVGLFVAAGRRRKF